jgi:F-box and WD-40 domain protein 1/11
LGVASDPRFRTDSFRRNVKSTLGGTWDYEMADISEKAKRVLGLSSTTVDLPIWSAPLRLDWRMLYRERLELELRWTGSPCLPLDESRRNSEHGLGVFDSISPTQQASNQRKRYDPKPLRITGHSDRYI